MAILLPYIPPNQKKPERVYVEDYAAYLLTPHWQKVREQHFKRGFNTCRVCGSPHVELHHLNYECLYRERIGDLIPLCRTHHQMAHDLCQENGCGIGESPRLLSDFLKIPLNRLTIGPKHKRKKHKRDKRGKWPGKMPEPKRPKPTLNHYVMREREFVPKWRDYTPSPEPEPWTGGCRLIPKS